LNGVRIGLRVKEERERRAWSQRFLGHKSGVSHAWISHLELGQYEHPGLGNLAKLAIAFGLSLAELLDGEGPDEGAGVREAHEGYDSQNPTVRAIVADVNALGMLDPKTLEQLAPLIRAQVEKAERDAQEEQRVRRAERRRAQQAGSADPPPQTTQR
jgi:transcriptional regulator with XRE-family HTH domain